jgi:hypothetical protein
MAILTYTSRAVTLGATWGLIELDIPVVSVPYEDPARHNFRERPDSTIGPHTMVIALTPTELIFGDVSAFSAQKTDVRNKFIVSHQDGSPQVAALMEQVTAWEADRKNRLGIRRDEIAILLPDATIPIPVVAATADRIKATGKFKHVTIAGGLL